MPRRARLVIWLVDDTDAHHAVARRTVEGVPGAAFAGFMTGADAVAAFAALASSGGRLPDIVLMDYYLGAERGENVTRELRRLEPAGMGALIVGYSSIAEGSERIVAAGGDLVLRKHSDGAGINPSLARWLAGELARRR